MRILTVGYGAAGYGFGRVLRALVSAWLPQHEVSHFEMGGAADPDFPCVVAGRLAPEDRSGFRALAAQAAASQPDLVFLYLEAFPAARAVHALKAAAPAVPVVVYCPIDHEFHVDASLAPLGQADRLCVFTDFAARYLEQVLRSLGAFDRPTCVVPHGIDLQRFAPLASEPASARRMARATLFASRPHLHDAFIVLNANRNQPRKRLDLTIDAFARFARGKEDAYLYFHAGMRDQGCRLLPHAERRGIAERLLFTRWDAEHPRVTDPHLNLIYGACDVGVNTAVGEGWGLVAFEHAATGAAQIVPDHTGCGDAWRGHALLAASTAREDPALGTLHEVDPGALAAQFELLYGNARLRESWSARALEHVRRNGESWPQVAQRFEAIFSDLRTCAPSSPS
ncbi:glycosyltransferase family 4 protein [Ramlibacter sp. G-1-2-2]|uniref:Glycosyltransferase family 4 protein n=1 Tax=Ramlibacter agri TaxID=2728837 RepID=A0A848H1A9_9BURK|nr:glycosyltransferase family 4 protein [Ramlibacter agri]NML44257.1 glycosyltransferase family 4 protein [Ramlibacter agri]